MRRQPSRCFTLFGFFRYCLVQWPDLLFQFLQQLQQRVPSQLRPRPQFQVPQQLQPRLAPQLALLLPALVQGYVLQLVLHPRPHPHQLLPMHQQLSQVSLLHRRYPDPGEAILQHQFQNQRRGSPVMLLLPPLLPRDRSCIPDPQPVPATCQQTLKPMHVPAGFNPYQHRPLQSLVESSRLLGMQQPPFHHFARFLVQHCDLLEARMKVTTYILHIRPPSSRALRSLTNRVYSTLLGAVVRHPIKRCRSSARRNDGERGTPRMFNERCRFREFSRDIGCSSQGYGLSCAERWSYVDRVKSPPAKKMLSGRTPCVSMEEDTSSGSLSTPSPQSG